jgi:YesN/AraC family two-component response regulator
MSRKPQLLIVDDDRSVTRMVSSLLRDQFHEAVTVEALNDPQRAREWIDGHTCDILMSDIEMPHLNGIDLLRFAKARNAWTQVIFMTSHSTWEHMAEAIELGATDYLLKPLNSQELREVLDHEVHRWSRWQNVIEASVWPADEGP